MECTYKLVINKRDILKQNCHKFTILVYYNINTLQYVQNIKPNEIRLLARFSTFKDTITVGLALYLVSVIAAPRKRTLNQSQRTLLHTQPPLIDTNVAFCEPITCMPCRRRYINGNRRHHVDVD